MSDLPSGWMRVGLLEVAEPVGGKRAAPSGQGRGRVLTFKGLAQDGSFDLEPEISASVGAKKGMTVLRKGDVVFTKQGHAEGWIARKCGFAAPEHDGVYVASTLQVLRPNTNVISPRYLYRWLEWPATYETIAELAGGRTALTRTLLADLEVPLAPRQEQERIIARLEEHLSGVDRIEAFLVDAERRVSVFDLATTRALFDSRAWGWTTLGEIAEVKGGVTKDSKRQSHPSFVEVPYLRVANVQRGRLDLSDVATIRVHPDKLRLLRLKEGDVLLNEGGDRDKLGRGWVWEGQIEDCIHQNHVFRARLNEEFDPFFVSIHANTWGRTWFEKHGRQTTNLASISLSTLKRLPVPAPPRREQEAIVAELRRTGEAQDRLGGALNRIRARARALRRSILAAAFAGQLVPQDPRDEPASVLLERIRAERGGAKPGKRSRRARVS